MTDPDGVAHEDYYDAAGQIVDKQRVKGATVADQAYSYDLDANRTKDEKGSESYNSRNQLVSWTRTGSGGSVSYVVNGAGAVVRSTDTSGPDTVNTLDGDRLTQATTTPQAGTPVTRNYSYDGFGNLTRIHKTSDGADTTKDVTYVYDSFERLITSKDPSLAPAPTTSSYTYDGLDRRDTQTDTASGKTTTFGYIASSSDLATASSSDGAKQTFDYDANGNRLGEQVTAPTTSAYRAYVTDAQGSVQGLEDPNGTIASANQYRYDPYGNPDTTGMSTEAQANPFRFQGFQYDPTANAYNAQAREYRPDIQRFLTQDRYEAAGADLNLATNALTSDRYAFVAGNPTNRADPDGHDPPGSYVPCDPAYGNAETCAKTGNKHEQANFEAGERNSQKLYNDYAAKERAAGRTPPAAPRPKVVLSGGTPYHLEGNTYFAPGFHTGAPGGLGGRDYRGAGTFRTLAFPTGTDVLTEPSPCTHACVVEGTLLANIIAVALAPELEPELGAATLVDGTEEIPEFVGPVRQSSDEIAKGHAFTKHVLKKGEFPEVSTPDDLARIVERVRTQGESRQLSNGRRAFYDARDNTVVIRNPHDPHGGTVFRPDNGRDYFTNELK